MIRRPDYMFCAASNSAPRGEYVMSVIPIAREGSSNDYHLEIGDQPSSVRSGECVALGRECACPQTNDDGIASARDSGNWRCPDVTRLVTFRLGLRAARRRCESRTREQLLAAVPAIRSLVGGSLLREHPPSDVLKLSSGGVTQINERNPQRRINHGFPFRSTHCRTTGDYGR